MVEGAMDQMQVNGAGSECQRLAWTLWAKWPTCMLHAIWLDNYIQHPDPCTSLIHTDHLVLRLALGKLGARLPMACHMSQHSRKKRMIFLTFPYTSCCEVTAQSNMIHWKLLHPQNNTPEPAILKLPSSTSSHQRQWQMHVRCRVGQVEPLLAGPEIRI